MLPVPFFTVNIPSATVHSAVLAVSRESTHWFRFDPLKRTMASEGMASVVVPGVTTLGTGCHCSVSSGLAFCCADANNAPNAKTDNKNCCFILSFVFNSDGGINNRCVNKVKGLFNKLTDHTN